MTVPSKTKTGKNCTDPEWLKKQIRAGLSSEEIARSDSHHSIKRVEYYRARFGLKTCGIFGLDEDRTRIAKWLINNPEILARLEEAEKSRIMIVFGNGSQESLKSLEDMGRMLNMKASSLSRSVKRSLYKIKENAARLRITIPAELQSFFDRMERQLKNKQLIEEKLITYGLIGTVAHTMGVPTELLKQWCTDEGVEL